MKHAVMATRLRLVSCVLPDVNLAGAHSPVCWMHGVGPWRVCSRRSVRRRHPPYCGRCGCCPLVPRSGGKGM